MKAGRHFDSKKENPTKARPRVKKPTAKPVRAEVETRGGARPGSGVPKGMSTRAAVKHGSMVVHAPRMMEIAQQLLYMPSPEDLAGLTHEARVARELLAHEDMKWAFEKLLPYIFRKQPIDVVAKGDNPFASLTQVTVTVHPPKGLPGSIDITTQKSDDHALKQAAEASVSDEDNT